MKILFIPDVAGLNVSKTPTMPLNEIWSVIRSMILNSAAVSGFRPRLSSSGLLRMFPSVREGLFGPCCKPSHLNCSTDLLRTPTALINSVSSARIAFFLLLVIRFLCFDFRISCFFLHKICLYTNLCQRPITTPFSLCSHIFLIP